MKSRISVVVATLIMLGFAASVHAASVFLVPDSSTVGLVAGDLVSFDIIMDFSTNNNGLGSDATLGGGFDIIFDPTFLAFDSLVNAGLGDPAFGRDPDILPGLLESWGFADFNGLTGPAFVGSVTFEVLAGFAGSTFVSTGPTSGIAGPFVSAVDFITILDVDFNSVEVSAIPIPAAVWFLLSGIAVLFGIRRAT